MTGGAGTGLGLGLLRSGDRSFDNAYSAVMKLYARSGAGHQCYHEEYTRPRLRDDTTVDCQPWCRFGCPSVLEDAHHSRLRRLPPIQFHSRDLDAEGIELPGRRFWHYRCHDQETIDSITYMKAIGSCSSDSALRENRAVDTNAITKNTPASAMTVNPTVVPMRLSVLDAAHYHHVFVVCPRKRIQRRVKRK
ncbi:hypothetical protein B0H34DRAFT_130570 [Crassisporium funariophilum]|nr:hypothetical protein B0H34DRAFT_130570 [Crassisporium funariophilum]